MKQHMGRSAFFTNVFIIIAVGFIYLPLPGSAQIAWPNTSVTTKPWTRWWWEGSAVNKEDLKWNLEKYQEAGLGGVELTPIYGVHGYEDQFIRFLSPKWMEMFKFTLEESRKLGLGVDLANATGWPFGGPWVTPQDASKSIFLKTYHLSGGERLQYPVVYTEKGFVRTANHKPLNVKDVKNPPSANKDLQSLSLDQIVYPGDLPLQILMAYDDQGNALNLTSKVNEKGSLDWTAPEGKWSLYALFEGLHGKMVERAAPGGEGYAIDHFSKRAVDHYFKKFDTAFKNFDLSYLRAFFNDSYEVDDARGNANWTPHFFEEFKKRRGYDLREYLSELFGEGRKDVNERVLFDYRSTIDELLWEHFTRNWKEWAHSKDAIIRNQAHGSPANILDLYETVDIPETEGTDILQFKFASSAGNVGGKQLVSSESATWLKEHFLSSLGDVKNAIDNYFLGGVNHIFYHGTAYSPKEAPWPGWLFYAAVHFQPTNPQWKEFRVLNEYITRAQSFLQQEKPDNDILLYYPLSDVFSKRTKTLIQHFSGMDANFNGTDFEHLSRWMLANGYSFDFFTDRQAQRFDFKDNFINVSQNQYQTILLPANKYIPEKTWQKLMDLANSGATILVYKHLPGDVPGLENLKDRQEAFQALLGRLSFTKDGTVKKARVGKGLFIMGDDIGALLSKAHILREELPQHDLEFIRKKDQEGRIYFIKNPTDKQIDGQFLLKAKGETVALFDPMTAEKGLAQWQNTNDGVNVRLRLDSQGSIIVKVYKEKREDTAFPYFSPKGEPSKIGDHWEVNFVSGGPSLPQPQHIKSLKSWTDFQGEGYDSFSGTATYTTTFKRPSKKADTYQLSLGTVFNTAEVYLNGERVAGLIGPDFSVKIPGTLLKKNNKLVIEVANLMANRIIYMDKNKIPWKIFYDINMSAKLKQDTKNGIFDASDWNPLPSGLLGPVTLTPLSKN